MKKYILWGIAVLAAVLIILNPTPTNFRDYIGIKSNKIRMARTANYLFFSTYELNVPGGEPSLYRGILKNFYHIQGEVVNTDSTVTTSPNELTDMAGVTSYYECPMKCEGKKFAEAGTCPVCGMDLVMIEMKSDSASTPADTMKQM